jgi:hypothetical protein
MRDGLMRSEFDASDENALKRLRDVLRSMGAKFQSEVPAPCVQFIFARIGDAEISISADAYIIELIGPVSVVERIVSAAKGNEGQEQGNKSNGSGGP